jgi:hypothetical protein
MSLSMAMSTASAGEILFQQAPNSLGTPRTIGQPLPPPVEPVCLVREKSDQHWNGTHFRSASAALFSDIGY